VSVAAEKLSVECCMVVKKKTLKYQADLSGGNGKRIGFCHKLIFHTVGGCQEIYCGKKLLTT